MQLYQKLNVKNLKEIQQEVLDYFKNNQQLVEPDPKHEYFVQIDISNLPILREFLTSRNISEIVETSTCFLPGKMNLKIHIDGLKKNNGKVPAGKMIANRNVLIIPIEHTEDSISYWYKNEDVADDEERIVNRIRPVAPYDFYVSFAMKDLKSIGSTIIDTPAFIKSDIYHSVHNYGSKTRLVFIVRFHEEEHYTLDDIFRCRDLI